MFASQSTERTDAYTYNRSIYCKQMHPKNTQTYIDDQSLVDGQDRVCQSQRLHHVTSGIVLSHYSGSSPDVRTCELLRTRFGSQTHAGRLLFLVFFCTRPTTDNMDRLLNHGKQIPSSKLFHHWSLAGSDFVFTLNIMFFAILQSYDIFLFT